MMKLITHDDGTSFKWWFHLVNFQQSSLIIISIIIIIIFSNRFEVLFGPSYDAIVVHTFKNKVWFKLIKSSLYPHHIIMSSSYNHIIMSSSLCHLCIFTISPSYVIWWYDPWRKYSHVEQFCYTWNCLLAMWSKVGPHDKQLCSSSSLL